VLRVIGENVGGGLFQGEVLPVRPGDRIAMMLLPAVPAPGLDNGLQGASLLLTDVVFGEQFP